MFPTLSLRAALAGLCALALIATGWVARGDYDAPRSVAVSAHAMQADGANAVIAARAPGSLAPQQPLLAGSRVQSVFTATVGAASPDLKSGIVVITSGGVDRQLASKRGSVGTRPVPVAPDRMTGSTGDVAGDFPEQKGEAPEGGAASGDTLTQTELDRCLQVLQCPATRIDGTLVTERDGTPDLLLSAKGRRIGSASFSPASAIATPADHPWLLGLSEGVGANGGPGLVAGYSFHALPLTAGGEIMQGQGKGLALRAWLLARF